MLPILSWECIETPSQLTQVAGGTPLAAFAEQLLCSWARGLAPMPTPCMASGTVLEQHQSPRTVKDYAPLRAADKHKQETRDQALWGNVEAGASGRKLGGESACSQFVFGLGSNELEKHHSPPSEQ